MEVARLRLAGINKTSLVDGIGVNYVVYFQGCSHGCKGCHNPSTHDYDGGYEITLEEMQKDIESCGLITGVTFSGGEPLNQTSNVFSLAKWCKEKGYATTLYTGYTVQFNLSDCKVGQFCIGDYAKYFDYIFDGKYDCAKRSYDTPFRGSSNQRMLVRDVDY